MIRAASQIAKHELKKEEVERERENLLCLLI